MTTQDESDLRIADNIESADFGGVGSDPWCKEFARRIREAQLAELQKGLNEAVIASDVWGFSDAVVGFKHGYVAGAAYERKRWEGAALKFDAVMPDEMIKWLADHPYELIPKGETE